MLAQTHEYMLACVKKDSEKELVGRATDEGVEERPFRGAGQQKEPIVVETDSFYALSVKPANNRVMGLEAPPIGSNYPLGPTQSGHKRSIPDRREWRRASLEEVV